MKLTILLLVQIFALSTADCPSSTLNYLSYKSVFYSKSKADYEVLLRSEGVSGGCTTAKTLFEDCNITSAELFGLSVSACAANVLSEYPAFSSFPDSNDVATEFCNTSVIANIQEICSVRCPTPQDISSFTPLITCLIATPSSLEGAALASYRPYDCLANDPTLDLNSDKVPDVCEEDGFFSFFDQCTETVANVIAIVASGEVGNETDLSGACTNILVGPLSAFCPKPFNEGLKEFCTPCSGLCIVCSTINLEDTACYGALGGVGALILFVIGGITALVCYLRRRNSKVMRSPSKTSIYSLGKQSNGNSSPTNYVDPPPSSVPAMASIGRLNSSPVSGVVVEPDVAKLRKQLIDFYRFHDTSVDPEERAEKLFNKYSITNIAIAIKKKYGMVPSGWEMYLPRQGSMSDGFGRQDSSPVLGRQNSGFTPEFGSRTPPPVPPRGPGHRQEDEPPGGY